MPRFDFPRASASTIKTKRRQVNGRQVMTNATFDDEMGRLQRALAQCEDMVARLREPDRARSRAQDKSRGAPRRPSHRQDGAIAQ
jgi:hypothetical protein